VGITVDVQAMLDVPRPLSDDEIADLILHVSDLLDPVAIDPMVTLIREGDGVRVHVQLPLTTDNPWEAQVIAAEALRTAFDSAVPAVANVTRGLILQEA
jgi:GTP cyclohydrolase III